MKIISEKSRVISNKEVLAMNSINIVITNYYS